MGILEFFRWNREKESKIIKKVFLNELAYEVEELSKNIENKLKIIKEGVNKNLALMTHDLRGQINVLESINLEQRKEDERIKKIVKENLVFYMEHIRNLINELENISNLEVKDYISKVQFILNKFYKKSSKSYEKATILIGNEIGQIKETIKNFNRDFVRAIHENKAIFIKINLIKEFRELENKIKHSNIIKNEAEKQINNLQGLKEKLKKQNSFLEKEHYKFKQSEEFKELLMKEQKFNEELSNFNNEILKIKNKIDIKILLKYHHNDSKYNELLKSYRENFIEALENDEVLEIEKLVRKTFGADIKKEILDLKEKNKKLKARNNKSSETKLKIFEDQIKNICLELSSLKEKEAHEIKKLERINEKNSFLANEKINKAREILGDIDIINLNKNGKD